MHHKKMYEDRLKRTGQTLEDMTDENVMMIVYCATQYMYFGTQDKGICGSNLFSPLTIRSFICILRKTVILVKIP